MTKVYMINVGCVEGVKPLELKDIIISDGENHPLDKKIINLMQSVNDCLIT